MTNQVLIAKAREVNHFLNEPLVDQLCTLAEALLAENASLHAQLDAEEVAAVERATGG